MSSAIESDQKLRAHIFSLFCFFFTEMLPLPRDSDTAAFSSETYLGFEGLDQNQGVQLIAYAGPLLKKLRLKVNQDVFYGKVCKFIYRVQTKHQ